MSWIEKYSPIILVLILLSVAEPRVNSSHPSLARAISSNPLHAAASGGYGGGGCCPPVVDPYTLFALGAGVALATYFLRVLITVTTVAKLYLVLKDNKIDTAGTNLTQPGGTGSN